MASHYTQPWRQTSLRQCRGYLRLAAQKAKIAYLLDALKVVGTRAMVDRYITPAELHRAVPEVVAAAAAAL